MIVGDRQNDGNKMLRADNGVPPRWRMSSVCGRIVGVSDDSSECEILEVLRECGEIICFLLIKKKFADEAEGLHKFEGIGYVQYRYPEDLVRSKTLRLQVKKRCLSVVDSYQAFDLDYFNSSPASNISEVSGPRLSVNCVDDEFPRKVGWYVSPNNQYWNKFHRPPPY